MSSKKKIINLNGKFLHPAFKNLFNLNHSCNLIKINVEESESPNKLKILESKKMNTQKKDILFKDGQEKLNEFACMAEVTENKELIPAIKYRSPAGWVNINNVKTPTKKSQLNEIFYISYETKSKFNNFNLRNIVNAIKKTENYELCKKVNRKTGTKSQLSNKKNQQLGILPNFDFNLGKVVKIKEDKEFLKDKKRNNIIQETIKCIMNLNT
jgi:hypothetical protein